MSEQVASITRHLEDLRRVFVISFLGIIVGTLISYGVFLEEIMELVTRPLTNLGEELVFIGVTEGFITQAKLAFFGGIILSSPIIIWQILSFILPGLYTQEKKIFWPIFLSGIFLFIIGIYFGYTFVLELGLEILLVTFSSGLTPMISINKYVSFVMGFLLPFGIVFQIPLVSYFLTKIGLITPGFLKKNRRITILVIFIIAAILTPADVISQFFLAVPMLILFEVGVIISTLVYRKK